MTHYGVCIPTYQRPQILELLLRDLLIQTLQPEIIVIVDGDSFSGEVLEILRSICFPDSMQICFVPSNHANLSYQRYLGWIAAHKANIPFLLYLDDDLRLYQKDAIEKLMNGLRSDSKIVGITSRINFGAINEFYSSQPALIEHSNSGHGESIVVRLFGSAKKVQPGGLTPTGNRIMPFNSGVTSYSIVQWLHGGVMLFRMSALKKDCFSADLFALDHIRCGKGEDTFLARQVMQYGMLVYAHDVIIDHPNSDLPKTYPISAYKLAYATAYSRRFLNDHYRITRPPYFMDRLALLKSYIGNSLINFGRAFAHPRRHRFAYAIGYSIGSLRGLLQKPTARNLTPHINWQADAEKTLPQQVILQ